MNIGSLLDAARRRQVKPYTRRNITMSTRTRASRRFTAKQRSTAVTATKRDPVPAAAPRLWWIESDDDNAPAWQPKPADEGVHHR
jgi:hypothetical protein